jgi:hypothetical protein
VAVDPDALTEALQGTKEAREEASEGEEAPDARKGFDVINPNLRPEDQDVDMEPVVLTPGAYASPDPATQAWAMVPLTEAAVDVMAVSADFGQQPEPVEGQAPSAGGQDYNSMTVAELKQELDNRGAAYDANALKADLVTLLEEDDATQS